MRTCDCISSTPLCCSRAAGCSSCYGRARARRWCRRMRPVPTMMQEAEKFLARDRQRGQFFTVSGHHCLYCCLLPPLQDMSLGIQVFLQLQHHSCANRALCACSCADPAHAYKPIVLLLALYMVTSSHHGMPLTTTAFTGCVLAGQAPQQPRLPQDYHRGRLKHPGVLRRPSMTSCY